MKIDNHLLSDSLFVESPNHGGTLGVNDTVVIHYTGGYSAASSIQWLCSPASQASAHVLIGRDGKVTQLVRFDTVAWHAGKSSFALPDGTLRVGYNQFSIGIELDNAGILEKAGDRYHAWFKREYSESEVFHGTHRNESAPRCWHRYTEAQIAAAEEVCCLLKSEYGVKYILGHEEVSPLRKTDPGPAFPLDKLRERLLVPRMEDAAETDADASRSAIVLSPRVDLVLDPANPWDTAVRSLESGTRVSIVKEENGWCRIRAQVEGWVPKKNLDVRQA
jgi:N-acetylmuramoyl-L-alanine amidase